MNNLAQTLYAQGDLPAARDLQEQVLAAPPPDPRGRPPRHPDLDE